MPLRKVTTIDGVIDALGGLKAIAALTDVWPSSVYTWKQAGRFPARLMDRIQAELEHNNATAVRDLFDFDPPRSYAQKRG
jgi:hypothetical protein